jgi:hypothetical protein
LRQLDISNCMVTQQVLPYMRRLTGLRDLRISNRVLDDVAYSCDGQTDFSDLALTQVDKVAVEHENAVQVQIFIFNWLSLNISTFHTLIKNELPISCLR